MTAFTPTRTARRRLGLGLSVAVLATTVLVPAFAADSPQSRSSPTRAAADPAPTSSPGATNSVATPNIAEEAVEPESKARLSVAGLGWIENLKLKNLLRQVQRGQKPPAAFDATFVEDAAFLLLNHIRQLGFLRASLTARATEADGAVLEWVWTRDELPVLPRQLAASRVDFVVTPGFRYFYEDLQFEGLEPEEIESSRAYFVRTDGLLKTRQMLRFSQGELQDGISNLRIVLGNEGYDRAAVTLASLDLNHDTGAARVRVKVEKGARYRLRKVEVQIRDTTDGPILQTDIRTEDRLLSKTAREDFGQSLLSDQYKLGYADATVKLSEVRTESLPDGEIAVDFKADVVRGPRIALGEVRFESRLALRNEASLASRARLDGPWLDRLAADEARSRLARRGGFRSVRVRYDASDEEDPAVRDVVYELEPGKLLTVDLLAGYRSYDLLYGGIDLIRRDVFGVGHVAELRASQSFRSTEGYVAYSIPDAFAEDVMVFSLAEFLRREEVSFIRQEFRMAAGVRKVFAGSGQQAGVRYSYEILSADDAPIDAQIGSLAPGEQPDVGAVTVDWSIDRRDSALNPRSGYQVGTTLETALPEFGGGSRYLRPEITASTHFGLKGGRFVHLGIRGIAVVDPSDEGLIPFNKRIFPGGETSVRGYQRGEAGPKNDRGEVIGAESAIVWMLEFEQLLTTTWSVVGFVDGVAEAADISQPPWDEVLWSAGLGIRWNSFIGPVRLEYGYNLTPRESDPAGTLHFSVGFPF